VTYTTSTGVLIAIFGFSLFRRRLIRPIALVREGTRRIAEGEFGHQVDVDAALELRLLCDSLNAMSTELSQYRTRTADQMERLRRANMELQAAQTALVRSERLAGVGRLAAGLAHEIGNPLSAVLGFVEFLEQPVEDVAMQEDLLRRSRLELERIHGIIRGLLDYSRLGSGEVEPVDVVSVVRDAIDLVRHIPRVRSVEVTLDPPPRAGGTVSMQRDLLQQVFVNILLNAAHAARSSDAPAVSVAFESHAEHLSVVVCDNGPGFDDVALERALEPFFTTKEPGQGPGLGLATAARIVEGANGELGLANQSSGGARVEVRLPYEDGA
jgi:signal transduction histidine kinase